MRRNLLSVVAGLLAFSITFSAGAAERRRSSEPTPPPPPPFRVDVATRTMSMARLIFQVPVGAKVGVYCYTPLCSENEQILSDYAFRGVPQEEFAELFMREAQTAGYTMAASNTDMFASADTDKAELLVGAAITGFEAEGQRIILGGYNLEATITVDWQVFDPLEKKTIYKGNSRGIAKVRSRQGPETLPRDGARASFQEAAKAILMEPGFLAAVRDPRGGAPAQPNALFPEENISAAPPTVQIARLPLSSTPFRQHVQDLMKQVITVVNAGGTGSGFYTADGLILTNEHVVRGYTDVRIKFFGGREVAGRVIASDARRDIALIKTESVGVAGLPLRTEKPEVASPTFVIGSPLDPKYEGSVISGIVSGFRDHEYGPMIQSDVQVTHGNSGGPMFDEHGNVIALVDIGIPGQDGTSTAVNLFIPVGDALAKLNIQTNLAVGTAPVLSASPAQALAAPSAR